MLVSFGEILFRTLCFSKILYWTNSNSSNNQCWNDNKPVLKIPLVLTLSNFSAVTGDPLDPSVCFYKLNIENNESTKAVIWNIKVYTTITFYQT